MSKSRVLVWALWDCGSAGLNAIVVTFVFNVYLTTKVAVGGPGGTSPASWLGRAMAIAGVTVALLVSATAAMSLIHQDPRYPAAAAKTVEPADWHTQHIGRGLRVVRIVRVVGRPLRWRAHPQVHASCMKPAWDAGHRGMC